MSAIKKLSITLTSEMVQEVKSAVQAGEYASSSEVIHEALQAWRRKRGFQEQESEELQKLWLEGIEIGNSKYHNMDEIKQAARKRLLGNILFSGSHPSRVD